MASRKEEKEQRRQARIEAERAEADAARRKRLMSVIGAVAVAAVVVVGALILISQSGSDDGGGSDGSIETNSTIAAIDGMPQDGTVLGEPKAEVKIVEFGDLQCPACKEFSETAVPKLLNGPVAAGDAQIEFKNFVIIGPDSTDAAKAALAASEQGRYWQFIEIFYLNQGIENSGYVTDELLTDVAKKAGVKDLDAWNESRQSDKWDDELDKVQQDASKAGFTGTPSVLVEGPGGTQNLGSFPPLGQIEDAIQQAAG